MSAREVAIVLHGESAGVRVFGIMVRRRALFGLGWWWDWRPVWSQNQTIAWPHEEARKLADGCLADGWIDVGSWGAYHQYALPIVTKDEE